MHVLFVSDSRDQFNILESTLRFLVFHGDTSNTFPIAAIAF